METASIRVDRTTKKGNLKRGFLFFVFIVTEIKVFSFLDARQARYSVASTPYDRISVGNLCKKVA